MWKKQRGRGTRCLETREPTPAEPPRASLSPHREVSRTLFTHLDQRPSAAASDLVSFGGSECDDMDDSMSLLASDAEELSSSSHDPTLLPSAQPSATSTGIDAELFHVLSKVMEELSFEWSPPEEPTRSRLDEWFLPNGSCRGAITPFVNGLHHSSQRSMTRSPDFGIPPTRATDVPLLHPPSKWQRRKGVRQTASPG